LIFSLASACETRSLGSVNSDIGSRETFRVRSLLCLRPSGLYVVSTRSSVGVIKWCARRDLNPQPRPSRASFSNHSSTVSPPGWDSERLLADAEANRRESKSHGWSRFGFREGDPRRPRYSHDPPVCPLPQDTLGTL